MTYALTGVAANAQGIIATSNTHFSHSVNLHHENFDKFSSVKDFLNNDQLGWDCPNHIEVGSSGDFYAAEENRNRIVQISPEGKITRVYPIRHEEEPNWGKTLRFIRISSPNPSRHPAFD